MPGEKDVKAFLKGHRRSAAGTLAAPLIIVSATPGAWAFWVSATTRLTALYAFTLIFMNIFTGALAPYFYVIFKARGQYLVHFATGALGFLLALSHGLIVVTQRYYRGFSAVWVIGPVVLGLLAVTVWVALDRERLKKVWRAIHQINYVIFVAVFVKAVLIGTDLRLPGAASQALKVLFSTYVALAGLAVLSRLRRYQVQVAKRRGKLAAEAEVSSSAE